MVLAGPLLGRLPLASARICFAPGWVGAWALDLPLGAAVLLGAILAPTDPVLAAGVPSEEGPAPIASDSAWREKVR
jgi:hypothetical protein